MSKKTERLATIRGLIGSEKLSSQEELLARLRELGIEATQSTLSRDMKELKAVKVPHEKDGYMYVMPENIKSEQAADKISSVITENIIGIDFSANLAVIKTNPGYANAVAVLIDNEQYEEIVGTIAGDDNILIILREGAARAKLLESLSSVHPGIDSLYNPSEKRAGGTLRRIFK